MICEQWNPQILEALLLYLIFSSRALQKLNMTFIAPSTSSEVYVLTKIAFGFYS